MKNKINRKALILSLFLLFTQGAEAVVFEVTTAEEFQAALATAASNGGDDEILLATDYLVGNFYYFAEEPFNISVRTKDGFDQVVLDADRKGFGVYIRGNDREFDVVLKGFEVKNANAKNGGGGVYVSDVSGTVLIDGVQFTDNFGGQGSAVNCNSCQRVEIVGSLISNNQGSEILRLRANSYYLNEVRFSNNHVINNAPFFNLVSTGSEQVSKIESSTFSNNITSGYNAFLIALDNDSSLEIKGSKFEENSYNATFLSVRGKAGSILIEDSIFRNEGARPSQVLRIWDMSAALVSLKRNRFISPDTYRSQISIGEETFKTVENIQFKGNLVFNSYISMSPNTEAVVTQNTIVGASSYLYVIATENTEVAVVNNIVRDTSEYTEIVLDGFAKSSQLLNNIFEEVEGFWITDEKNIVGDPAFWDETNANFYLSSNSPAIDAGNNDFIDGDYLYDLDGNPRIENDAVDIGAFERYTGSLHPADTNGDGAISQNEFEEYNAAWRTNETWPTAPEAIPVDFVTRAGYLLQKGGAYKNIGVGKPATWVPIDE
jgi:hypothetical protein